MNFKKRRNVHGNGVLYFHRKKCQKSSFLKLLRGLEGLLLALSLFSVFFILCHFTGGGLSHEFQIKLVC